jgi:hypothetical protein
MAGKIRALIDEIIERRGKGDRVRIATTRTKLFLKGINPDRYNASSPDDPDIIRKLVEFRDSLAALEATERTDE